ncbi:CdaR family transcriptional regulator [Tsukamurella sp. PLM1]|uniref:PucR family transcriptional regulator n=1 Tax=Tsukamurella sp. PLM1 TaxID=2929795 RepID=UPI00206B55C7|nr:PucR family transcriptional regulator [Tsukamurella sp. PLM1]BDH59649.1 hypothetical protein MTP03_45880 [Tsukamurella sp. PLM1]
MVGVVPPVDFLDVPFTVGLGPQVVLADLALSYRLASRARSTGEAYGSTGVQRFEALGLRLAVAGDPDVGEGFARTVFARLDAAESATALMETVRCHLELGARVEDTAAALFVHANTVRYRLSRFHELTGLDLRRPADAFRAWWAIEAEVMRNR